MNRWVRKQVSLNGEWSFAYRNAGPGENGPFPEEREYDILMPVPGCWDDHEDRLSLAAFWSRDRRINPDYVPLTIPAGSGSPPDMSFPYLVGCGWYRRSFYAEADWEEKSIALQIGGVTMEAWVWLNGKPVGRHEGHQTPFSFSLSGKVEAGRMNELILAVSNIRRDRSGCSIRGDKGRSGGIRKGVFLEITGSERLEDCYVYPDPSMERLCWRAVLSGAKKGKMEWEFRDLSENRIVNAGTVEIQNAVCKDGASRPEGVWPGCTGPEEVWPGCTGAEGASMFLQWESGAEGLRVWSDRDPKLYRLHLRLVKDGQTVDELERDFGLRLAETAGTQIFLNKTPVFLRGATDHAYFPETCTAPESLSYYMNTLKTLKSYGFNWIRFHTWIPPEECMEAADRLGMLIQVETANGFSESEWLDAVRTCRIHPSVILYCCGNEVRMDEAMLSFLEKMAGHLRTLAPDVLFHPMESLRGLEYDTSDGHLEFSEELFRFDRLERLEGFSDVLSPHGRLFSYHSMDTKEEDIRLQLEKFRRPCLLHEIGINDSYPDLTLEARYEKARSGGGFYRAVREYAGRMGVLERAPLYYQNSCGWMKLTLKYALENARRCGLANGYDLLGAVDCHWHRTGYACGFLNEFYEAKSGFSRQELLAFNGESVLLADVGKERNRKGGDILRIPVYAALWGEAANAVEGEETAVVEYRLTGEGQKTFVRGSFPVSAPGRYGVSYLGEAVIAVPGIKEPVRADLKIRLSCGSCQLENSWEYWLFPEIAPFFEETDAEEGGIVTDRLDEGTIRALLGGERVLLLGSGPFPSVETGFQIMSAGRPQGLNATVIEDHPVTRLFPHEGWCGWQFQPMMDGGRAVVFNGLPVPFKPIIEMVSGYKIIRKQAAMFELQAGKGKLLVCTLNLEGKDPGTVYLRQLLEHYICSGAFRPGIRIDGESLRTLIGACTDPEVDFSTDEGDDKGGDVR